MSPRTSLAIATILLAHAPAFAQSGKSEPPAKSNRFNLPLRQRWNPYGPFMGPYTGGRGRAPQITTGNNPRVRVQLPARLDWEFALSPASAPSAKAALVYDPTNTLYQVWVPATYRPAVPNPILLFLSAKAVSDEWVTLAPVCQKHGIILASLYSAGDEVQPALRLRMALDVLDDIRRRLAVDTDRIYLGGFSEGARTACELAFAYPELVGGVLAVGAAGPPRSEPWMRQRMKERLSLALVTGQADPGRFEIEKVRFPVLRDLKAQARLWSVPGVGQTMPPAEVIEDALVWMDSTQAVRKAMPIRYLTSRMPEGAVPLPEVWARGVVEEAHARLADSRERDLGLLQLEGVIRRWPDGEAARAAQKQLDKHDAKAKESWQALYNRTQQAYFLLEARAFDAYFTGLAVDIDLARKAAIQEALVALWDQVAKHGADTDAGRQAKARLGELRRPAAGR